MTDKTLSKPTILTALLAYLTWNGTFLIILFFNLCLLFGSNFITISSTIGTRLFCTFVYVGVAVLFPFGGWRSHLNDGMPWREFSQKHYFPGSIMRSYLKMTFGELPPGLVEAEAKPDAQFIFAAFPHGCGSEFRIILEGCIQNVLPNIVKQNKLRTLAASILFRIPLIREVALWTGCIDANRRTASKALDRGKSLLILPGGEAEQILTTYGKERIYLSSRKGFIKLAMRKNIKVVPTYVFGSSDLFYTSSFLHGPRKLIQKKLGICIPICFGLFGSLCPLPRKVTIVFGEPLVFATKGPEPTTDELDHAHETFCKELVHLFDEHKESMGYNHRKLEII